MQSHPKKAQILCHSEKTINIIGAKSSDRLPNNYIEGNYKEAYSLLEIIYANEKGFPKNSNSVLFGAYILGAAATYKMDEPIVSQKLMDLANDIDSQAAKGHYEYFLSIRNK